MARRGSAGRTALMSTCAACSAGLQVAAGLVDASLAAVAFMLLTAMTAGAAALLGTVPLQKKPSPWGKKPLLFQETG